MEIQIRIPFYQVRFPNRNLFLAIRNLRVIAEIHLNVQKYYPWNTIDFQLMIN